jgi:hypothetical protein
MAFRQTRLIARLLLATVLALAAATILWCGPDAGGAALTWSVYAICWSFLFDRAARARRWRRNLLRAGDAFALSWIGTLAMVLTMQAITLAEAAGHPIDRRRAFAALVALLLLAKANALPKSRPAWFNGVTLPPFAPDRATWRRVHRASAVRLAALGAATLAVACLGPRGADPLPWTMRLLVVELGLATLHGLWLSRPPPARPDPARG